ncbi:holin family protein [Thalassovita mangrovi]|uniref:Carboxylesterase n=1 Tax=Thalassovita mangrovi TaxID=2692236 RepID=A0A6L8LI32_9RHOB|nr:holin family protein [Thalassovita mangrovi]MYM54070.1 carboxylesterase [Thalassovita mangrovi]
MGLMASLFEVLFGPGQQELRRTVELFRENAEARAVRAAQARGAALRQFGAEFQLPQRGRFDRLMDAVNRLPRPGLALGTLGLFAAAMADPEWFAARMQGLALVPEPLWWLLGAIVSFYFGARHQAKGQEFQARLSETLARAPQGQAGRTLERMEPAADTGHDAALALEAITPERNPALEDWREAR